MNRVKHILQELDGKKRDKEYQHLCPKIGPYGNALPLNLEETLAVLEFLRSHKLSTREKCWLLDLLKNGTFTQEVKEYVLSLLEDKFENTNVRGLSFLYIQIHAKELIPGLADRFKKDRSPHVRYRIASTIKDKEKRCAYLKNIQHQSGGDHALADSIMLELAALEKQK